MALDKGKGRMMTRLGGLLAAAVLAMGLAAPKAEAVVIYDWVGTCTQFCSGEATAVLTLADSYVPGTEVMDDEFISFSYRSNTLSYDIPDDAGFVRFEDAAVLPAMSGTTNIDLVFWEFGFDNRFGAFDGFWDSRFFDFVPDDLDRGNVHLWTLRQPTELTAPGPLSLLVLGLAGLALAGRQRVKVRA